jgi:hypothetical protein
MQIYEFFLICKKSYSFLRAAHPVIAKIKIIVKKFADKKNSYTFAASLKFIETNFASFYFHQESRQFL